MKSEAFISCIKSELDSITDLYAQGSVGETEVGMKLDALGLSEAQRVEVVSLLKQAIDETTYTLLCGLEGSASLGGSQQMYKITDETGTELSGELDVLFYEQVME